MTERTDKLALDLSLEEKVGLLAGADLWHLPGVERAGIPRFKMTDGPVGARGAQNTTGPPSACFPCGTALAATWDVDLVHRVGVELGAETLAKGAHLLLAPTVNLHRSPLAGRNFECYSEDPCLTARMAVAYVTGVQSQGVGCCIKHFVANDSEFERFTISSEVPERALRELYLRPFEVAIAEADPVAVMSAYNKVSGTWCSENPRLLTGILRDEWGYDGLLVSDWFGTHSTADAANAGLDVEMPGPPQHRGPKLVQAAARGDVGEAVIDRSAQRVLNAMERTGAFSRGGDDERADDSPERRAVARDAARSAIVLLRNDGALLPLAADSLRRVAVVGPNADALNILGGGSASVSPYYAVTPLEGLRARLAGVDVVHEPGCSITRYPPPIDLRWVSTPDGDPGIGIEILDGEDPSGVDVLDRLVTRRATLTWAGAVGRTAPWSARMRATLRVPVTGRYVFQAGGMGRFRVVVDGETVVDGWEETARARRVEGGMHLTSGDEHQLVADFVAPPAADGRPVSSFNGLDLRAQAPFPEDAFERAVEAARQSDVAIVVVGTNGDWETEGRDRRSMDLPGAQVDLVRAVVAANPRTVVVVNAGSPVTMDWAGDVPAVLQSWFLGQETGNAVADVLTGDVDASGRLPTTIPRRLQDTPAYTNYPGEFGRVHYGEGLFVGYRWYDARDIPVAFPFGHGLSYATFEYGELRVERTAASSFDVVVDVSNTSTRDGVEVVQVYVRDVESSVVRPPKELKAFAKVPVPARTTQQVRLSLDRSAFAFWDEGDGGWRVEPGEFEVLVGSSSADIRRRASVAIDG